MATALGEAMEEAFENSSDSFAQAGTGGILIGLGARAGGAGGDRTGGATGWFWFLV